MKDDYLFNKVRLSQVLSDQKNRIQKGIENMGHRDLSGNIDDIVKKLYDKHSFITPKLLEDEVKQQHSEEYVERRGTFGDHFNKKMLRINITVPIQGSAELFNYQPSTHQLNPPQGETTSNGVVLTFLDDGEDPDKFKNVYQGVLNKVKEYCVWIEKDIEQYNNQIKQLIKDSVVLRKTTLDKNENFIDQLGIPSV
jgi:hypothetical protein